MDFYYKVDMSNQWRLGNGGFVDLNCGWYCQDALLSWYSKKNRLNENIFKKSVKFNRMKFGFNPVDSFCNFLGTPGNIMEWKETISKRGPVIISGKLGLADFGFLGGVGHYVLVVGVRTKRRDVIIYDPLTVDFSNPGKSKPSVYKFDHFARRVDQVLTLNNYSLKNSLSKCFDPVTT